MAHRRSFYPDEELSEICTKLWYMDTNACIPGTDFQLDLQGYVTDAGQVRRDRAENPMFEWVEEERVFERPTYKAFRNLLDNYESETGEAEVVTDGERKENWDFLNVVMETDVMQEAQRYLVSKEKAPEDETEFKKLLYKLWFRLYRRTRGDRDFDSSGFEHVFVGETRDGDVTGFHNWIQLYLQEKRGNIDYRGYFRRGTAKEENPCLVTIQFIWNKMHDKPIGSSFIGTSPEFELALYTLVFLMDRGEEVPLRIADYTLELNVYRHGAGIGTAFPEGK